MKAFLVWFMYDHYCQGYEDAREYALVYATSFIAATIKIKGKYRNAREFENMPIE